VAIALARFFGSLAHFFTITLSPEKF